LTKDILDQINGENFYLTTTLSSNDSGKWKESNFYWLAKTRDQLDYDKSLWYVTPLKPVKGNCANYQQMLTTPREKPAILDISCQKITNQQWTVTLKNASSHFAFFTELSLIAGDDNQWLIPIF
jgi:exo-1,4-beta-D-glucosaminidase